MNIERLLVVSIAAAGAAILLGVSDFAGANATRQGDGELAQEPMHLGATVAPNFLMAIDDSGSMRHQTMLLGSNGGGCWDDDSQSFFTNDGELRSSGDECRYYYLLPSERNTGATGYGIPPIDSLGFARSPDFNPSYYNPDQTYQPWIDSGLSSYGNASISATLVDPRDNDTINLFSERFEFGSEDSFRVQNGMRIADGVRYRYRECVRTWPWGSCREYEWTTEVSDGFVWDEGEETIYLEYMPGTFYLKQDRALSGYTDGREIEGACGNDCSLWRYEPNTTATRQNFANWFSYYGNRNRAMVAGLTRSMQSVSNLRVGYFTINGPLPIFERMLEMGDSDDKKDLYEDFIGLGSSGSTPNRAAVVHMGEQFHTNSNIIQHSCQKNAAMLFTDGYSNDGSSGVGNEEGDGGMPAPFRDEHGGTLADVAAKYYNTILRGDAFSEGNVPLTNAAVCEGPDSLARRGADCNADLHMNFYGITLGAKGDIFGVTYGVGSDGVPDGQLATDELFDPARVKANPAWRSRQNDAPSTIDEIWHATVNARGDFINATTPAAISDAMRDVLASVGVGGGVSGSLAITGSRLGDSSLSVEPTFDRNGVDWFGDVVASKPSSTTGSAITYEHVWTASEELPQPASRNLFYATTDDDSTPSVANFYDNGPSDLEALCANFDDDDVCGPMSSTEIDDLDVTIQEAVQYLAGDRSLEGTKLRTRTHPLGDIINSTPVVSAPTDDFGYALLRNEDGSFEYDPYGYNDHLEDKEDRPRIVYVGANDGMLHAFNGETGVEQFGYIPATAVGYMGNLLFPESPDFQHRYYVDGPVAVSDALFGTNDWRTVLVGTSGAGGRSVFGLDVDDVGTGNFSDGDVLWEVNDQIPGAVGNRIGHVLGKPVIVPVRGSNGEPEWKAIFGGGYGNRLNDNDADTRGTVTLFVVDMESGDVEYIDARESGGPVKANGLGNIVALDRRHYSSDAGDYVNGSDGMVDTVYGADLHGNVWKFDLTETGISRVALGGRPLFTATDGAGTRQAITGGLEAALGPRGGVMLLFGTGSFSYVGDKQNDDIHSVYGVLDMPGETLTLPLSRGSLQAQTVGATSADGTNPISSSTVNYFSQRGWYLDLVVPDADGDSQRAGERMVGYPRLEGGTLFFPTYAPDEGDACSGGGINYLYGLAALSGAPNLGTVHIGSPGDDNNLPQETGRLPLDTDGAAPIKDVNVFTTGKQSALAGTPDDDAIEDYDDIPPEYCMAIISVAGSQPLYRVRPCGRQSWRQIR